MNRSQTIRFDLLSNAQDSLRQAVHLLAWKDIGNNHGRFKHAITNAAHATELLLKERLRRVNAAFVWENVDKYPNLEALTVTVDTAISRLTKIAGVSLSEQDKVNITSLRKTRNAIEHYEWAATESEVRLVVGNALSFAFDFGKRELDIDLSEEFKKDDTWRVLVYELYQFARAHGARIEAKLQTEGKHPVCCDSCGELTVPLLGGSCELCGHWQDADDV